MRDSHLSDRERQIKIVTGLIAATDRDLLTCAFPDDELIGGFDLTFNFQQPSTGRKAIMTSPHGASAEQLADNFRCLVFA